MPDVQYLTTILQGLVVDKEGVSVVRSVDELGVLLTAKVSKQDMGKVIGREGTTIKAIRHIVKCFGYGMDAELGIKLEEPA